MSFPLRPYQASAIERVMALYASGVRRVLLVLPTGGGKTVLASELIRRALAEKFKAIFLAHRRELIKNTFAKLVDAGLDAADTGVVMAGVEGRADRELLAADPRSLAPDDLWRVWARRRPRATIQLASVDTFRNRAKPFLLESDVFVVVDEAHRALAKSYRDIQADYPGPRHWHLGLTATPLRADGKPLSDAYDEIVVCASFADLVEDGFLVEPTCFGTKAKADLSGVSKSGSDYNREELATAVDKKELVGDIVDHWRRRGGDAPTFCFAASVAHSQHIVERFKAAGVAAAHVDGETDTDIRDAALSDLREGRIKVLCNVGVYTEGTDVPVVKTIVLARPTLSEGLYLQMAGRGARPCDQCASCLVAKANPALRALHPCERAFIILDHAGCCSDPRLGGLPQELREWTLEGKKKKAKDGITLPPAKECPGCLAIVPRACSVCVGCGHVFAAETIEGPAVPEEKEGELVQLQPGQVARLRDWNAKVDAWEWANIERRLKGEPLLSGGTVKHAWKEATGTWPPMGSKLPKLSPEDVAYNEKLKKAAAEERAADRAYRRTKQRHESVIAYHETV